MNQNPIDKKAVENGQEKIASYPASNLMLTEIKSIYCDEYERNKNLENKAAIGLSILGVLLTIGINELEILDFKNIKIEVFFDIIIPLILLILFISMVVFLVITVIYIFKSLKPKPYKHLDLKGFSSSNAKKKEDIIAIIIMEEYKKGIKINREINNEKAKYIDKVIQNLIYCISFYIAYALIYKVIY